MSLKRRLRTVGFRLMLVKPVNVALRTLVRPFARWLPWGVVHSIPMIGDIALDLPDGRRVTLVSDGYDSLASRIHWSGIDGFEPESLRLFLELAESSETVLDVGAHVGLYALLASTERPDTTTIAFEPVPRNLRYLRANVARNEVPNLRVEEAAVGAVDGSITLRVPRTLRLPATASVLTGHDHGDGDGMESISVPVVSIDRYVQEHHLGTIDLLKIDVEGAEADVLRGAAGTIARHRPAIVCEILYGIADTAAATAVFDGLDYRFFLITSDGLVEHERLVGDPTYFHKNYLLAPTSRIPKSMRAASSNTSGRGS